MVDLLKKIPGIGQYLSAAPWVIAGLAVVIGGGGTLWYRSEWKDCQASVAIDANKAEERLRRQQAADAELRRQLSDSLAPIVNDLRKQANDIEVALAKVPSNPACRDTPAARAFDSGVRPAQPGQAGAGPSRPARP